MFGRKHCMLSPSIVKKLYKDCLEALILSNADISRVTLGKIERGELGVTTVKSLDAILSTLRYEISFIQKRGMGPG